MARYEEERAVEHMSGTEYLLCIDIGTSSVKAACVDRAGQAEALSRERVLFHEAELRDWHADRWLEAIRNLVERMPMRAEVSGVVLSGNGPTLVPLDRAGNEVGRVLMWIDGRDIRVGAHRSFYLPKIAWLRETVPSEFERVERFLSCPEYVAYVLTGEQVMVTPSDEFTEYFWSPEAVSEYGIDPSLLPPFASPGDRVGTVSGPAADKFGISAGIPVFVGGADFLMSLLGTATVIPGRTCDRAGTSEGINACSAAQISDGRVRSLPHVIPGMYNNAGILSSTGRMFEWFRDISGQTQVAYDVMLRDIDHLDHERDIPWFFPTLRRGASWEFSRGIFIGLGAIHGRVEMGRSVVESIGFSVREAIEILEENGEKIDTLRACGGQAKNPIWNQMKANITGKRILVPRVEDAEIIGNACVGWLGLGRFNSLAEAAEALVHMKAEYSPNSQEYALFSERFERYGNAHERLRLALTDIGS